MPNDESCLKRDDPLNSILAQTDMSEPLKWELKQKPGMSPPCGGFRPDDPNQQIVADHDEIFDEYEGIVIFFTYSFFYKNHSFSLLSVNLFSKMYLKCFELFSRMQHHSNTILYF
jgi:hypothetical protein